MSAKLAVWLTPLQIQALRDAIEFVTTADEHGRAVVFTKVEIDRMRVVDTALARAIGPAS